jgi:hypothetical protein
LVAAQHRSLLCTAHVNQAENLSAIGALPEGRRRAAADRLAKDRVSR